MFYEPGRWVVIRAVVYDKGHGLQLGPWVLTRVMTSAMGYDWCHGL